MKTSFFKPSSTPAFFEIFMVKIKKLKELVRITRRLKKNGCRIVFTNGCFDLIHPGHIKLFQEAKNKGDILVVGVNSDSSIKRIKGPRRPVLNEKARLAILEHLDLIDYIVVFKALTPYEIIKSIRPNFLVKGGDWPENNIVGRDLVNKVYRVKLKKGHSTTALIKKIKKQC
ncbi:MAG: adenylyltransferase/cytidyltransferase family protein [Candidatus Omnitrophica bacterium]|nr:adenylyltransferase/cytidyltransferase family protein [Candidatus Omnitrophota bacterium]